jgi:hypothetical protein
MKVGWERRRGGRAICNLFPQVEAVEKSEGRLIKVVSMFPCVMKRASFFMRRRGDGDFNEL